MVIDKDKDVLVKEDRSTKRILKTLLTQHIKEQQANITSKHMHQHVCIIILLSLMINFNLKKNIIFPIFHGHKNTQFNNLSYFGKLQILGCYNSTPLKMNLVLEIWLVLTQITTDILFLDPLLFYK